MSRMNIFVLFVFLTAAFTFTISSQSGGKTSSSFEFVQAFAPQYPEGARSARAEGRVVVNCIVAGDGLVQSVKVLDGNPLLKGSAEAAALKWIFPVSEQKQERSITITFSFELISKLSRELEGVTFVNPKTVIIKRRSVEVEQNVSTAK